MQLPGVPCGIILPGLPIMLCVKACAFCSVQGQLTASFRQVRGASRRQRCRCAAASKDYRQREPKDIRVLVVGATGYIGKFVVKELIKRGYDVVAFAREKSGVGGKVGMDDTKQASHAA